MHATTKRAKLSTNPPFRSPLKQTHVVDDAAPPSARQRQRPPPARVCKEQRSSRSLSEILHPHRAGLDQLQKEHAALTQQLNRLKHDLNVAEQALTISKSNDLDHLDHLARKWQSVARDAADDVFVLMHARIRDTGGYREWQKMQQENAHYYQHDAISSDLVDADDSCFTIQKMLQDLNVDLDIIGYDVAKQEWKT